MSDRSNGKVGFSVWATPWGPMGAVAGANGIRRVVLPHYGRDDLAQLLAWEHQGAVRDDGRFEAFAQLTRDYLNGTAVDFSSVPCDLPGEGTFFGRVYRACRAIPYGKTLNYGGLAVKVGQPDAARAVATAMSKNPTPLLVPCHRVIYADGSPGGFSAEGGEALKRRLLDLERRTAT
jgi:methylated-DNA-[protein]-cysteine S-methyltransferase